MSEKIKRRIALNLNFVNDDVVEIARPVSSTFRGFLYVMIVVIATFALLEFSMPPENQTPLQDAFDALVNPEKLEQRKYEQATRFWVERKADLEQRLKENNFLFPSDKEAIEKELSELDIPTLEEYKNNNPDRNESEETRIFIYFILPFILIFLGCCIPEARPIRIDRKNGLIYFKSWWKYFLYQIPQEHFKDTMYRTKHIELEEVVPLKFNNRFSNVKLEGGFIALYSPDKKSIIIREIWVGKDEFEKEELEEFIIDFINYKESPEFKVHAHNKSLCKRVFSFSFFSFGYNEKKTEAFIQAYLEKYGNVVLTEQRTVKRGWASITIFGNNELSEELSGEYQPTYTETVRTAEEEVLWQRLQKALKHRVLRRWIIFGTIIVLGSIAQGIARRGG